MKIGSFIFSPKILPSIAFLCLLPLFIALGQWQISRAEEKIQILSDLKSQSMSKAVALEDIEQEKMLYHRVVLNGVLIQNQQFLLDNRVYQGKAGYEVLTPFKLSSNDRVILVNRGWVSVGYSREVLPEISIDPKYLTTRLEGLFTNPSKGFTLEKADLTKTGQWPLVLQYLDYNRIEQALGEHVISGLVQLDSGTLGNYPRIWKPIAFSPEKHYAYALQWFAMALVLMIIYIVLNTKKIAIT